MKATDPFPQSTQDPNHKIYFIISEPLLSPDGQSRACLKSGRNNLSVNDSGKCQVS